MSQVFPGIRGDFHDMGYPFPSYVDWDGDKLPDLLAGCAYGNYAFYRRTAMDMPARPTFQIGTARMLDR